MGTEFGHSQLLGVTTPFAGSGIRLIKSPLGASSKAGHASSLLRPSPWGQDRQSDTAEIEVGFVKTELAVGLDDWPIGGMIHGANRGGPPGARLVDGISLQRCCKAAASIGPENVCHLDEGPVPFRGET